MIKKRRKAIVVVKKLYKFLSLPKIKNIKNYQFNQFIKKNKLILLIFIFIIKLSKNIFFIFLY